MSENFDILAVTGLDDSVLKSGFQGKTPNLLEKNDSFGLLLRDEDEVKL